MAKGKGKKQVSCDDCFFRQRGLCALKLDGPCCTFRPAERELKPERQLAFVFRTDRLHSSYAFTEPQ